VFVVEPTVMAEGTKAGLYWQASGTELLPELPAATTTVTPPFTALSMLVFTVFRTPRPPRLALNTAGFLLLTRTQSSALMNQEKEPLPESLRTFTAWSFAFFATP